MIDCATLSNFLQRVKNMTEEERNSKIVGKMDKLLAARKEYGMLLVDLKEIGVQLEAVGSVLKVSPFALKISPDRKLLITPSDKDGNKENLSTSELPTLVDNITRLSTLSQKISRTEAYLREAGYGDVIK